MARKKYSACWSLIIDLPLIIALMAAIAVFEAGFIPTYKSGYYCIDKTLDFKQADHYINDAYFYVLGPVALVLPMLIFYVCELFYLDRGSIKRGLIVQSGLNTFWLFRAYIFGLLLLLCVLEVMKGIAGRPRPTFFDTCSPTKPTACTADIWVAGNYTCSNKTLADWFKRDSYHSFPSGYTALSVYAALFVVWYLQQRAFYWQDRFIFTIPLIQLLCVSAAAMCSILRVNDHRNHVTDVIAGAVIGLLFTVYAVLGLCRNFIYAKTTGNALDYIEESPKQREVEEQPPSDDQQMNAEPAQKPYYPDHQYQDQQYQDQSYQEQRYQEQHYQEQHYQHPQHPQQPQTKTRAVNLRSNMLLNFGLYK